MSSEQEQMVLGCRDLSFRYQEGAAEVFADISLSLRAGEAVLLMGPSGCGKSSLAYCLAGLYPEYAGYLSGTVFCAAGPLSAMPACQRAQHVAILFQNPDDQFCMDRVDREILFALENINYPGDLQARLQEVLEMVGLEGLAYAKLEHLSGGTKQKVALACALAVGSRALILDEPFANVDPAASRDLAQRLRLLQKQQNLALFIIDHRLTYWREIADRVLLMQPAGRLAADQLAPLAQVEESALFRSLGLQSGYQRPNLPPPPQLGAAIQAQNLSLFYGKTKALDNLSFTIPQGQITALLGKNGAGKTTLLWAFAGLLKQRGELRVAGRVGLVFQNPGFQFLCRQVREEILLSLRTAQPNLPQDALWQKAATLLQEFRLEQYAESSPYMLSQGQQRRLAVLAMLAGQQDILLLDEPTYAQDAAATRFMMDMLAQRVRQGLTAVISTHDYALAEAYAQNILLLQEGQLMPYPGGQNSVVAQGLR